MKRYSEYKDSGVEWIGEVPSHWEVLRLKNTCSLKGRIGWNGLRSEEFKKEDFAYLVTGQDFISSEINWSNCYQISKFRYDEDPFIQLANGDMLITKDGTIGKVAKVANMDKPACLNSGIFVIKQKSNYYFTQDYLYWILVSNLLTDFNCYTSSGTTILHLYQNVFENMPIIVPRKFEQQAIATYLDKKCGEIDSIISTQQKRIALLEELKQSTITHAVTKGLNQNAPMKDSGVEWIGEVPRHWMIVKIKNIVRHEQYNIKTGPFGTQLKGSDLQEEGEVRVYNQRNVIDNQFDNVKFYVSKEKAKTLASFYTKSNDILITSRGTIGKAAELPKCAEMGLLHPCLIAIRTNSNIIDRKFLLYMINEYNGFSVNIKLASNATTIDVIYTDTLKNILIPMPPLSEQQAIAAYLDKRCASIDESIQKANHEIELLQEYKQSLIAEAVTGKRKVC